MVHFNTTSTIMSLRSKVASAFGKNEQPEKKEDISSQPQDVDHTNQDPDIAEKTSVVVEYPYTVFNSRERYFIATVCGVSGFWSAVSGNIYYPIIFTIENKFHVTEELANVSVVLYFLFQGLSPMIFASLADSIGRKPVVLTCCIIYIIADICIAVSNAYWLILFLRCIQAIGISPVIAINSGVCADLATRANRGSLIGFTSAIQLLAQALGAFIGGLLASGFDSWRAIFWFLAIGCGVSTIVSFFLLPETKRTIVGNGSIKPSSLVNRSPLWLIPHYKKKLSNDYATLEQNSGASITSKFFDVPKIVARKESLMILLPSSLFFTTWTMMFTSLSTTLQETRGYTVRQVGLCFIAPGVGGTIGSILSGKLIDWYYRMEDTRYKSRLAKWEDENTNSAHEPTSPKPEFDIFRCRLALLYPCSIIYIGGVLIFGWCLDQNQPLAPILIGCFMASFVNSPFVSVSTNLLADLNPTKTSTSTACVNLTRCIMSACGVAALAKMQEKLTVGGCFTLMSGLCGLGMICISIVIKRGNLWIKRNV